MVQIVDINNILEKNWKKKFNCAQITACSLLEYFNFEEESKILMNSLWTLENNNGDSFICGAYIGALEGISYIISKNNSIERKHKCKQEMNTYMMREYKSLQCSNILSEYLADGICIHCNVDFDRKMENEQKDFCHNLIKNCVHKARENNKQ
jgi:hypothetical protein